MSNIDIGILVGRFQTPDLHEAHKELIDTVIANHKKVTLFLGVARSLVTQRNPLGFTERRLMIKESYPHLDVQPISDCLSNKQWAEALDAKIREIYPTGTVTLYGGRDSFIDPYMDGSGKFPCTLLETKHFVAATDRRRECSKEVIASRDFRHGVIYAAYNQFPKVYPTVDIAIVNLFSKEYEVLLGRKPNEEGWRFVGGFVDPGDSSFETAARRECQEETGLSVSKLEYIGSYKINDWRYNNEVDKIITTLFMATYVSGAIRPGDDINELKWFQLKKINDVNMFEGHVALKNELLEYLKGQKYVSPELLIPDRQLQGGALTAVSAGND